MRRIVFTLIFLIVVSLGLAGYFYQARVTYKTPEDITEEDTSALIQKVGKLMVLPSDEVPTIATVTDPEKLKGEEFFLDARVGDKVLIYTNAKKAILYNPSQNKIIAIAPINTGEPSALVPPTSEKKLDVNKDENTF
jgi:hypothetical protein